jgi:hypothetical protein
MLFDWTIEATLVALELVVVVANCVIVAVWLIGCVIVAAKLPPTINNFPPATASSSLTVSSRIVSSFGFRASPDEHQLKVDDQAWATRLLKYG